MILKYQPLFYSKATQNTGSAMNLILVKYKYDMKNKMWSIHVCYVLVLLTAAEWHDPAGIALGCIRLRGVYYTSVSYVHSWEWTEYLMHW